MKNIITIIAIIALSGCTTAGPFVTNVSPDGHGGLIVEKCKVNYNGFLGTIDMGQCMTSGASRGR